MHRGLETLSIIACLNAMSLKTLAFALMALPLALVAEEKTLPLVLPKSVALGTPKPMKIDNLEPISNPRS